MALDFSVLQGMDPAGAFFRGQEAVRAEQERNMLRQMQMEQMAAQRENVLAQRQEREAHAEERRLSAARRQEEDAWLGKMADLFGQNNVPLTPETAQQGLAFALRSRNPAAIQMMQKTVEAMQARQQQTEEDARAEAELARITGRSTGAAPPVMRQPATAMPAAPAAPANLLAGTPYDIGVGMPMPSNALAARTAAPVPAGAEFTREQVQQMLVSTSPRIREQGKALAVTLLKEPKQPTELEIMQQLGFPLTKEGYAAFQETKKPRAPSTTVVIPPQEKAEKGERGKMLVKDFEAVKQSASIAARTLPAIDSNIAILDKGFDTGFGTEAKTAGARILSALGVKDAEKYAATSESFLANATQGVLQRQLEQKGPQTEADAQRITQTGAQLGNTKTANRFLLSVAKAQLKRDVAQRDFYANWYKKNGTYDGAEDAWLEGEGGKSLFDRPELKSYADMTPTQAPAAGRARPPLSQIFR